MKRSTKITSAIISFFLIITIVIVGRTMIGNHFAKKFSKRPPPGIIVKEVSYKDFSEKIESYGTAVSKRTESFRIKKDDLTGNMPTEKMLSYFSAEKVITNINSMSFENAYNKASKIFNKYH